MATSPPTRQFFFRSRVMRRRKARSSRNQLGHYSSINTRTPPAQRVRSSASTCHSFAWSEGFTSCATGYFRSSRPDFRSRIWGQMAWRITKRTSPASRVAPLAPPPAGVTTGAEAAARRPRHRISPAWGGVAARRGGSPLRSEQIGSPARGGYLCLCRRDTADTVDSSSPNGRPASSFISYGRDH